MKRQLFTAVLFGVALCVAGAASAASPFGSLGGQVGGGNGGAGVIPIHGWALDDNAVAAVDILVDGRVAGRAQYGRSRPGVAVDFPGYPDSAAAGFAFELDSTRYLNGNHQITARVLSAIGETRDLGPLTLQFTNLTSNLVPFGVLEFPNANSELTGTCDPFDDQRRYSVVSGYALDVGVEIADQGVGYVELLIDGSIFGNSLKDCVYDDDRGGLSDCYGMQRLDISRYFPGLSDSAQSGFRFVMDVGALISFGYTPGKHVLTIRAGDVAGQVANIDEIPVVFRCQEPEDNEKAIGFIGGPRNGLILTGTVDALGWALDWEGVDRIQILVDGNAYGVATHGGSRPRVTQRYPGYPESAGPGWSFALDTTQLSNGRHLLQVLVRDDDGDESLIGEREIIVFNP
jgi:N-acetylmuramoyl-L-alanine amidase